MEWFGYTIGDRLGDLHCSRCGLHLGREVYRGPDDPPPGTKRLPVVMIETHVEVEGAKRVTAKELPPPRPGFVANATAAEWLYPAHIGPNVRVLPDR